MAITKLVLADAGSSGALTDLSIIGVPESAQSRKPGISSYPKKFSGDAYPLWKRMVQDDEYNDHIKDLPSVDAQWHQTIMWFLAMCEEEGVLPFANNTDITKNEFIAEYLTKARIYLVNFFNHSGFFEHVRVRRAFREYKRKDQGLIIQSYAEIYPLKQPALGDAFKAWLVTKPEPRFHREVDNRYMRQIMPHIYVWVRYLNHTKITVGFDIEVAGTINIPGNEVPTRKQINSFIDQTIWLPILRTHRIDAIKNRLF